MRSLRLILLALVSSTLTLAGCLQGAGDRCQVQSDCADGLTCVLPPGGTPQAGGTCEPPSALDAGVGDLMPPGDLTMTPADLAKVPDATPPAPDLSGEDM